VEEEEEMEEEEDEGGGHADGHEAEGAGHQSEGGAERHEGGAEEEPPKMVDLAVAVMLFGSIVFNMSLFYLVHNPDKDIQRYSWQVISKTLSIFTAVLMYQGISGVIDSWFVHLTASYVPLTIGMFSMLLWFCVLHYTIRKLAREKVSLSDKHDKAAEEESAVALSCWSMLFAHMTGFASISVGGKLVGHFSEAFAVGGMVAVCVNAICLCALFVLSDYIRNIKVHEKGSTEEKVLMVWEEAAEEAENDVAGLCISFTLTQAVVALITGEELTVHERRLHGQEHQSHGGYHSGVELDHHPDGIAPLGTILLVLLLSLVFAGLTVFTVYASSHVGAHRFESEPGQASLAHNAIRWWFILQSVCAMTFAWLLQYAGKWEIARSIAMSGFKVEAESITERVIVALAISLLSFLVIFFLDFVSDLEETQEVADRCIRSIIVALGILIGFSWEYSFDGGVEVLVRLAIGWGYEYSIWLKLLLAILVAIVVVPAWRLYIQKKALSYEEHHQDKVAHEREYRSAHPGMPSPRKDSTSPRHAPEWEQDSSLLRENTGLSHRDPEVKTAEKLALQL